jgi:glycosyltransferase involved in cell wall biosynthesis
VGATLVLLPTYNEAENLPRLVAALRALPVPVEVLVVDDGSPDGTGTLADELARRDAAVAVLHRRGPRGYGEALTEGFREALRRGASRVVTMDSDFSHDPARVPSLLDALEAADVAIGSRYVAGGEVRAWSLSRRLLSASANAFVRVLYHLPARDCTSGFRAYRREVLEGEPWTRTHSAGYSFLVEVLYWATQAPGRRVQEVPIRFVDRVAGRSKMGLREIVGGAVNLLRLRLRLALPGPATRGPDR